MSAAPPAVPERDCPLCPRLVRFRTAQRARLPEWHNAPVPSFGSLDARLLVVGLAPGLKGANRTGRPFTGDYAGDLLYRTLAKFGLARGQYEARADDGLALVDCRITNAVRCVPPENKPEPAEVAACRGFLAAEIAAMPNLRAVLALGAVAHQAVLAALGERRP
ncbi:MAG TPA: uracil-DNA glycosylase, partial [Stellaceae bacterium]|nr:uracil-DNA glycosylase [Stellaceae bacterium]